MSAKVHTETAYVADCDECDHQSELFETRGEAEREAERHDEWCDAIERDEDPRTDRERYQDELDAIVEGLR